MIQIFNSKGLTNLTYRVGAYLLLLSNLALPLGLHRPWIAIPGWWLFPMLFCAAGIGALQYTHTHNQTWFVLVWPYALLFVFDTWLLALAPLPEAIVSPKREGQNS